VIAIRPGYANVHPAVLFSLAGMFAYAMFILLTRYLVAHDPSEVTLFYSTLVGTIFIAPWAFSQWTWPTDAPTWFALLTLGFWGGLGHYVFILAHRWAPAPTLAPFLYGQLVSVTIIGYLVFGQLPDIWTIIGAGIVVASGIYLTHRERMTRLEAASS